MGRWRDAIRHLTASYELSGGDPSQLPVLMDCHRALGHHRKVGELWDELRHVSPAAEVLVEGRLVLAADMAERGRLSEAIETLTAAGAQKRLRHPQDRHLRQWYLLADLYERSGDIPRARELFGRVWQADPELADVAERMSDIGATPQGVHPQATPASSKSRDRKRGEPLARRGVVTLGELSRQAPR